MEIILADRSCERLILIHVREDDSLSRLRRDYRPRSAPLVCEKAEKPDLRKSFPLGDAAPSAC